MRTSSLLPPPSAIPSTAKRGRAREGGPRVGHVAFALFLAASLACGPKTFTGAAGDQGGDGGSADAGTADGGAGQDAGQSCADAQRLCPHEFTFPFHGESSVSVSGTFTTPPWGSGLPMAVSQAQWALDAGLPWNTAVQYKFILDGGRWVTDPNNPTQVPDGQGGQNSELPAATCATWICGP